MAEEKPVKQNEFPNLREFFDWVETLPERPVGDGSCQLVKMKEGPRTVAVCQGTCDTGACITKLSVDEQGVVAIWCECG